MRSCGLREGVTTIASHHYASGEHKAIAPIYTSLLPYRLTLGCVDLLLINICASVRRIGQVEEIIDRGMVQIVSQGRLRQAVER